LTKEHGHRSLLFNEPAYSNEASVRPVGFLNVAEGGAGVGGGGSDGARCHEVELKEDSPG